MRTFLASRGEVHVELDGPVGYGTIKGSPDAVVEIATAMLQAAVKVNEIAGRPPRRAWREALALLSGPDP